MFPFCIPHSRRVSFRSVIHSPLVIINQNDMKKLLLVCSALLAGAHSWSQHQNLIENIPFNNTKGMSRPITPEKTIMCNNDTLRYPLMKEALLGTPTYGGFNLKQVDGYRMSMAYLNSTSLTINGVELLGRKTVAAAANPTITIQITNADANNNPTTVLSTTTLTVSNTSTAFLYAALPTPVTVTGNYAIQVYTTSPNGEFTMLVNHSTIDPYDEDFARFWLGGVYYNIPTVFGASYNFEPILGAIASYNVTANFSATPTSMCLGTQVDFTNNSTPYVAPSSRFSSIYAFANHFLPANYPADSTVIFDYDDGNTVGGSIPSHTYAATGTFTPELTIRGGFSKACVETYNTTISVNAFDDASFAYSNSTLCSAGSNEIPTVGTNSGTFSSSPTGLVFANNTTGEIDIPATTEGTYDITYTTNGSCPDTVTETITVTSAPDASFSFASGYCSADNDPAPVFGAGASAGSFSSDAGLAINSTSGLIDLSESSPGTYVISNSIAASGVCPAVSATDTITVSETPTATITGGGSFCGISSTPVSITLTGNGPWDITYTDGTTPVTVTGITSSPYSFNATADGTFTLTQVAMGGCSNTGNGSATIAFHSNPNVQFDPVASVCQSGTGTPLTATPTGGTFSGTGVTGNNFNPGSLSAGDYTLTYSYTDSNGCSASASQIVTINALPFVTLGSYADVCVYTPSFTLTGGTPSGGSYEIDGTAAVNFDPASEGLGIYAITYSFTDANGCSNTASQNIVVDDCVGISENNPTEVSIYPNPTNGTFVIELNGVEAQEYAVFTEDGKMVKTPKTLHSGSTEEVSLNAFAKGVYFVKIISEDIIIVKKVVLQ